MWNVKNQLTEYVESYIAVLLVGFDLPILYAPSIIFKVSICRVTGNDVSECIHPFEKLVTL